MLLLCFQTINTMHVLKVLTLVVVATALLDAVAADPCNIPSSYMFIGGSYASRVIAPLDT